MPPQKRDINKMNKQELSQLLARKLSKAELVGLVQANVEGYKPQLAARGSGVSPEDIQANAEVIEELS